MNLSKVKQELTYPFILNYDKFITGVSTIPGRSESYQFIFNDGDRTRACDAQYRRYQWVDVMVPKGKTISVVKLMYDKSDSCVYGIKFLDKKGA